MKHDRVYLTFEQGPFCVSCKHNTNQQLENHNPRFTWVIAM
jgi:hypothetical protein